MGYQSYGYEYIVFSALNGTCAGVGVKWKKEQGRILATPMPEEEKKGSSVLEGVGSGRVYYALTKALLDGVLHVDDQLALDMTQYLLQHEGLFVGNWLSVLVGW